MLIIGYSLDMFWASLCPSSGEKTTCYCIWGIFAVTREDADISRVVFFGDSVWFYELRHWCVCVAVSSWVCRSNVSQFVRLVRSGAWGWCLGVCISLVGGFLRAGALGVTWVGYCCC